MDLYEAVETICKDYCKYPDIESGNRLADICDKCPMNKCEELRWADRKDKPTTQTETQNSNLTFEKDECAKEYEELGLKELKELINADRKTESGSEKPNNCEDCEHWNDTEDGCADRHGCKPEPQICDTCRYYNSNIPCGSTPSTCKEADKFAEEFVEGLKKNLKPQLNKDINVRSKYKQGTWLYGDGVYCSCCGYKLETTALLAKCPKCGADMSKTDCAWMKGE